ncbi:MAG TPA: hypothetical protein VNY73_07895 [Bacteroidia bacterium]|nr:hypothetical protein [Bacteroidia bacterium]
MKKLQKHIAVFLLSVFSLAVIPAPLFHHLFANHTDTADNHCQFYHKALGKHIEEQQNHCDVFKTHTPLYDAVKVTSIAGPSYTVITVCKTLKTSSYSFFVRYNLPARAPPAPVA